MKSTKIRVASKMISVIIYMMAALGGYNPMLLLAGYVFLYEKKDERLRLDVMMSFVVTIIYSLINIFIGYIPVIVNWFLVLFSIKADISTFGGQIKVFTEIVDFMRLVVLIKLAADAYKDKNRELLYKIFKIR
ncbi:MAG: hypothetical protein J6M39_08085 [Lachnospiraceae bacterium]|nr:hypothetical protein [Lachnospiraceae bacterium]